jgi:uncharacterized protein (PEP-CTERM system associated)
VALGYAGVLAALPAAAENWLVTPAVEIRETYTTNANLAPSAQARSSFVTSFTPSIEVNGVSARARLNGSAAVEGLWYKGQYQDSSLYPQVNLLGNIEALEKFFYVEGAINIAQQYLNPFGPRPEGNIGATENRYTSYGYRVSPYIQGVLPGQVSYLVRNDNIWSNLGNTPDTPGFVDSRVTQWLARVDGPPRIVSGTVEARSTYTKFSNRQQELSSEIVRGFLNFRPDAQLLLYGIGGYEWNDYYLTESENAVYGGGFEWHPTERTTAAGRWEERFFGPSYLVSVEHRNPFSAINVNASRDISTYPQQLFALPAGTNVAALVNAAFMTRIPDPTQRAAAVQAFLAQTGLPPVLQGPLNFYTEQVIRYEQASATFTLFGVRNSLAFTVYYREQEVISGGTGVPLPPPFGFINNNIQRGGTLAYSHRLTPLTNLTATATRYYTTASESTDESTTDYFLIGLGTSLSPKTDGFTGLTYTTFDSNVSNDYDAFTAYIGLSHRF